MSDEPLKSAYELAMEKLKSRDREKGIGENKPLTEDQKTRIAEIRGQAKARLAQLEIMWKTERPGLEAQPEQIEKAEAEYVAERKRVEDRAEADIEKIRKEK